MRFITLVGDTTFGGQSTIASNANYPGAPNAGRWDMTGSTATLAQVSTGGNAYKLTKVGNNQISFVGVQIDSALGDVDIKQGIINLQQGTNGLGNPANKVTVESGGILNLYSLAAALDKEVHLQGGMLYAQSNSQATDNTLSGAVYVINQSGQGSTINTGGSRDDIANYSAASYTGVVMTINGAIQNDSGGSSSDTLTKLGPGTAIFNGVNTFNGTLNHNDGTVVISNSWAGPIVMGYSSSPVPPTLSGTGTISGAVSDNYRTNIAPALIRTPDRSAFLPLPVGSRLGITARARSLWICLTIRPVETT